MEKTSRRATAGELDPLYLYDQSQSGGFRSNKLNERLHNTRDGFTVAFIIMEKSHPKPSS